MPRPARTDLIGKVFGRLLVTGLTDDPKGRRMAIAKCECGTEIQTAPSSLERGATQSCGCLKTTHGHAKGSTLSPTYISWSLMLGRCNNPNNERHERYGGRGIKVCERWHVFQNFLEDMGKRPAGLSIDRINNDGDYEPGNCRWATTAEQLRNRSVSLLVEMDGQKVTLKEACRTKGIDYQRARRLVKTNGATPGQALQALA